MFKIILLILFLISSVANAQNIKNIEIEGNKRIPKNTIIMFSDVSVGDKTNSINTNIILKNLYDTNFFSDVQIDLNENILKIKVVEFPIVQNVLIEGIKSQKIKDELLDNILFKERTSFNEIYLNDERDNFKRILQKKGYYFSDIQIFIENISDNKINLKYLVDLGEKSKIRKITFLGNKVFKDKKLKNIILSEEYKFWKFISGKKFLNETLIIYDKNLLKNFYLNKGYYNVKINSSFSKLINNNEFELIYNIDAGQKIYFNDLTLNLPEDFEISNYEEIDKLFKDLKDNYYSLYNVEKILNKIETITINEQYESIDAKIEEEIISNKINISFNIKESPKSFIKKINIYGNNVTEETVIRNQVLIDEGDPFNEILYTKSINNIKSLNFFRNVKGEVLQDDLNKSNTINITIEEKPTGEIFAGAGTGTNGTTVSFGVRENNYLGKGVLLDTNANISADSIRGKFLVENPNYKNSDKSINMSIEASEFDRLSGQGYKSNKTGFSTGTKFEYYDDLFLGVSLQNFAEKVTVNNTASSLQKKNAGNYFDSFLGLDFNYDKRNQKFDTTDGFFSNYSLDLPVYSETGTLKNTYNFKKFSELYENNVSTLSLYLSSSFSINDKDIKLSERLFIPGSKLRGFERGKVGPKDGSDFIGGNYLTTFNLTTSIPKLLEDSQTVDFIAFFDAANVWGVDYNKLLDDKNDIRSSVGLGINLLTPIGPLSFSYAEPITKNDTDIIEKFRFNLGTTF
tara:strand:+ start:2343 stop:4571 length:2229 start_codon:yes stop_codon:yes gene_type:complete